VGLKLPAAAASTADLGSVESSTITFADEIDETDTLLMKYGIAATMLPNPPVNIMDSPTSKEAPDSKVMSVFVHETTLVRSDRPKVFVSLLKLISGVLGVIDMLPMDASKFPTMLDVPNLTFILELESVVESVLSRDIVVSCHVIMIHPGVAGDAALISVPPTVDEMEKTFVVLDIFVM
jgi:hypothetical protein